jgi:polysaccharide biosynthesis transport protein
MKELMKYLQIVYRRRFLVIGIVIPVTAALIAGGYNLPKKYQADSTVFIETSVINEMVKGIAFTPNLDERIRVLKYAMLSRDIISKVLRELDVDIHAKGQGELQDLISDLQKRTQINVRGKELFTVSIIDPNPAFAQEFINRLVRKYVEENISGKRQETYGATRFLDEQLIHFKQKLDESEDAIIRFRREQGVFPSINEESLLKEMAEYRKEIEGINLTVETGQARMRRLQIQLREVDPKVAMFSERQKEDRLARIEERIGQLLLSYTEHYPEVLRLRIEADELRRRLENNDAPAAGTSTMEMTMINPLHQDIQQKLLEMEAEISSLVGRKARLQQLMGEKERELQNIPESRKVYSVLVQERDSLRKIYEELLLRLGQSEVSKQMEIGDKATTFRIVDPAVFPAQPVSPDMMKIILMAVFAGLGCAVGAAILLDSMHLTVREAQQLRNMGLEILAVIPCIINEVQTSRRRRMDILAFSAAALYVSGVLGVLAFETIKKFG